MFVLLACFLLFIRASSLVPVAFQFLPAWRRCVPLRLSENEVMIEKLQAALSTGDIEKKEPLYYNLGLLLIQTGDKRAALNAFIASIRNAPSPQQERDASWYNIALIQEHLGDNNRAIESYESMLKLSNNDDSLRIAAYNSVIRLCLDQGQLEKAALTSNEAVKEYNDCSSLWNSMGVVLSRTNQNRQWSIKCFENSLDCVNRKIGNDDTHTKTKKTKTNGKKGFGPMESTESNDESDDTDPNRLLALNNLGALYGSYPDPDNKKRAVMMYRRVLKVDSTDVSSMLGLATLLRDLGQYEESKIWFERALVLDPKNTEIPFHLAMIAAALGSDTDVGDDDEEGDDNGRNGTTRQAPAEYVRNLFNYYAESGYDDHMINNLQYKGPQLCWEAFEKYGSIDDGSSSSSSSSSSNATIGSGTNAQTSISKYYGQKALSGVPYPEIFTLEIGTGSGMCGKLFRSQGIGLNLHGCDLSANMLAQAQQAVLIRDDSDDVDVVYSKLFALDAVEFLKLYTVITADVDDETTGADLILAADVLCYLGDLTNLMSAAYDAMKKKNGVFVFTVEQLNASNASDIEYRLQSSGRFAHSCHYIRSVAQMAGLDVVHINENQVLRRDGDEDVLGMVVTLAKRQ